MNYQKWIVGPAALTLALGVTQIVRADDAKPAKATTGARRAARAARPKVDPAEAAAKREAAAAEARTKKEAAALEELTGKPLTDDQKAQLLQAVTEQNKAQKTINEQFQASRAKIVGMTAEDLAAKERDLRAAKAKEAREKKAAATTTTTTTTTTTAPVKK
jgi:hypothetical protein